MIGRSASEHGAQDKGIAAQCRWTAAACPG
jgi:hypothetical protein